MTDSEFARLLRDAVPEPSVQLSPDVVVRDAKRRSARRLSAVGGSTAVAVAAAVFIAAHAGNETGALVGTSPEPSAPGALPPCAAAALVPAVSVGDVTSNGFTGAVITLTNSGKAPCRLAERITSLTALKANAALPIIPVAGDQGGPQDLQPGGSAAFSIASKRVSGSGECTRLATPSYVASPPVLSFELPGTGTVSVSPEAGVFTLGCWPIVVGRLYAATPPSTASPAPDLTGPFRPTDVTFVSPNRGWAISPGRMLGTVDGGDTWTRLTAPPDYADHLRFANDRIGYAWAVQRGLYITRDGGRTWQPAKLTQVYEIEAAAGYVWALAGNLPYPNVWRGAVGGPSFTKLGQTPDRDGSLDVHGPLAYVVGVQGAGPIAGSIDVWNGTRRQNSPLPCQRKDLYVPDSPLGVSTDGSVFLVCAIGPSSGESPPVQRAYVSRDEGGSWSATLAPPETPSDVTATRRGLFAWGNNVERYDGSRWTVALAGHGFVTVGFQDDDHGVALGRDGILHLTRDGGATWTAAPF
jgi:hypothetical protein